MENDRLRNISARHSPEFTTIPPKTTRSRSRPHRRAHTVRVAPRLRDVALSTPSVYAIRSFSSASLRLPLHEGVEQTGPCLILAVVAEILADALREVQKHVPGVARDAAHTARVLRQEVQPALQHRGHVQREDEPPQSYGDGALQRALALLGIKTELESETVKIFEALLSTGLL